MTSLRCVPARLCALYRVGFFPLALVCVALFVGSLPLAGAAKPTSDEAADSEMPDENMPDEASESAKAASKTAKTKTKSKTTQSKATQSKTTKSSSAPKGNASKTTKAKTTPAKPAARKLQYGFKDGEKYVYDVEIVLDLGDSVRTISGRSNYVVKRADDDEIVLAHDGRLVTNTQNRGGTARFDHRSHRGMASFPPTYGGSGEVTINTRGEVIKNTSVGQLPCLLGPLALLVLEPLSADDKPSWEVSNNLAVLSKPASSAGSGSPASRSRSRMSPRGRVGSPAPAAAPTTISAATETTSYKLGASKGDLVTIKRHLELSPQVAVADTPAMGKISEGDITFDRKTGVPRKATLKERLQVTVGSAIVELPLTITYRLLTDAEVAKLEKEATDRKQEMDAKVAEANRPLDESDVRRLLQELKVADKRREAARRLAKGPANDQREQVKKALAPLLKDKNNDTRKAAVAALATWGDQDSVPALIPLLDEEDVFLRSDVIKALGKLPDERAAEALAKHFYADRGNVGEALRAMGPMAEPHVLPLLEDREEDVRVEACKVLAAIGTDKSREALRKLAEKGKGSASREASEALRKIAARE